MGVILQAGRSRVIGVQAPPVRGAVLRARHVPGAARIRGKDLPVFTRTLGTMLSAGMPLGTALNLIEHEIESNAFKAVVRQVRGAVSGGMPLTAAMAQFPAIFDTMFVGILKAGEISGKLAESMASLASYLEATEDLRRRVRSAMMYPVIVACVAALITAVMMIWIVPAFEKIYADLGGVLPAPTQFLILASKLLRKNALIVIVALFLISLAIRRIRSTNRGGYLVDAVLLKIPVFGDLKMKVSVCRFAESLAQMLASGIPVLKALELSGEVTANRVLMRHVAEARAMVEQGETVSVALKRRKVGPPLLTQLLAVGESVGRMDEMLMKAAEHYRNEVDALLRGLTAAIEPLLIVVLGVVLGGIVVGMFLPIFKLHEIVRF